jgi:putative acetyltransferase
MISVKRTTPDYPSVLELIKKLDKELWERYPTDQAFFAGFNKLPEDARVVIAFDDETPVGCGAFKPLNVTKNAVEIKRMYVDPSVRGRAIGVLLLENLEKWAKEDGFDIAQLETGINQPEAIRLYEKVGYERIPNYEPYIGVELSLCYAKKL